MVSNAIGDRLASAISAPDVRAAVRRRSTSAVCTCGRHAAQIEQVVVDERNRAQPSIASAFGLRSPAALPVAMTRSIGKADGRAGCAAAPPRTRSSSAETQTRSKPASCRR
jgi:hypothetical protein